MKKNSTPPVHFRPDLFPGGDSLDKVEAETVLRWQLEEYLTHHSASLQDKVDQLIRDALAGIDVRDQLHATRPGKKRRPTSRTMALSAELGRLMKGGIRKAEAVKLIVGELKANHNERRDPTAVAKEINRAARDWKFGQDSPHTKSYELKLKEQGLI